jgi:hypothetical protein
MRNLSTQLASGEVYLSSPAPDSADRGYHRIWGSVKGIAPAATYWGRGGAVTDRPNEATHDRGDGATWKRPIWGLGLA